MAAKKKAKPRRKAGPRPLSRQQLLERDPWHFDRDHPIFAAICKVYVDHPGLVYDHWAIYGCRCTQPARWTSRFSRPAATASRSRITTGCGRWASCTRRVAARLSGRRPPRSPRCTD